MSQLWRSGSTSTKRFRVSWGRRFGLALAVTKRRMRLDLSSAPRKRMPWGDAALHRRLRTFNRWRLRPDPGCNDWRARIEREHTLRLEEGEFVEAERARVRRMLTDVPNEPESFVAWYEALESSGPGQRDPLFDWLAEEAPLPAVSWFVRQELASEAGFDDLVALTQIRMPVRPKLELARNYWDEMGRGQRSAMHGPMLTALADTLGVEMDDDPVWESLALANLMTALAFNRRFAYQSIGALGAIELTAPRRSALVNAALKRLGVEGPARRYFAIHATLDVKHSEAWNEEVLAPLVARDPRVAPLIAEGALLRLGAGARCYERYRRELGRRRSRSKPRV